MREFRLKALDHFIARPTPTWGGNLGQIDFDDIHYFVRASERSERSWDEVPDDIKKTFDKLGIPEAERKFLSGVGAQYESESVYHQVREDLEKQGVIFMDMDSGLREHEAVAQCRAHAAPAAAPGRSACANHPQSNRCLCPEAPESARAGSGQYALGRRGRRGRNARDRTLGGGNRAVLSRLPTLSQGNAKDRRSAGHLQQEQSG